MIVGVDIGGTFTDLVLADGDRLLIHKLPSTPHAPEAAMLSGLAAITGGQLAGLGRVAHGTTVATNAILERKGAPAALITTQGFRDLLFIGRQHRPDLYALHPRIPSPLIPRERCHEVPERLDHTGAILTPLDTRALQTVIDQIIAQGVWAVAVCLLYSTINPIHEQMIREALLARGFPDAQIALSSDVLPERREFERAGATALEAYVRPVISRYIGRLSAALAADLTPGYTLRIMKSDGGVFGAALAQQQAIQTALSGPAAGVIGAAYLSRLAGYDQIITLDIGGTSTDVSLCPGTPLYRHEREIDGLPLRIRQIDIETIGAGGGSIARLDAGGVLHVGPQSAGADPGSIIYGRGGIHVTVSDANAVLGRLDAGHFLGGEMHLEVSAAEEALARLGASMRFSAQETALGIIRVANASIDRALRRVSVGRGYDPRDFTLVAFGGAGPLHACEVAHHLGIRRVLIPRYPGVLCAFGLLAADVILDSAQTVARPDHLTALAPMLDSLRQTAGEALRREGFSPARAAFRGVVDMRYQGQSHELTIPYAGDESPDVLRSRFHAAHTARYGHALPDRVVEAVTLRLQAVGHIERPALRHDPLRPHRAEPTHYKATSAGQTACYARESLTPGALLSGPALVFQQDTTLYLPPGWAARADGWHNLICEQD